MTFESIAGNFINWGQIGFSTKEIENEINAAVMFFARRTPGRRRKLWPRDIRVLLLLPLIISYSALFPYIIQVVDVPMLGIGLSRSSSGTPNTSRCESSQREVFGCSSQADSMRIGNFIRIIKCLADECKFTYEVFLYRKPHGKLQIKFSA